MSEKTTADAPTPPEAVTEATATAALPEPPDAAADAVHEPSGSGRLLSLLLLLVALCALLLAAAVAWLGHQKATALDQQLQTLQQAIQSRPTQPQLQAAVQDLQQLPGLQQGQQQLGNALSEQRRQLGELERALVRSLEPRPRDWQLAEVEYLLRLANQRLQLEEDIPGALTLFRTAEQRLRSAEIPGTLNIRARVLDDIEVLRRLPVLDRVSLALELQDLADQALELQVRPLPDAPVASVERVLDRAEEYAWYQRLWQEIRSLIVIRKRELPIEPLPDLEEELALRYQISTLLMQASWAALRGEATLYQQSLTRATQRLQAFDAEAAIGRNMQQRLAVLARAPVHQELPAAETSLESLQSFMAQRYAGPQPLVLENPAEPPGDQP